MTRAWITGPETLEVRTEKVPVPARGEVLIAVAAAGICGSDLYTFRCGHPWLGYPIAPGHEAAGTVVEVGPTSDEHWAPGQRVYLRPAVACGHCFYCTKDLPNLCASLIGVGSHTPGAFADYVAVPQSAVAPIPDGVSFTAASMIEPLATAVHAVRTVGDLAGRTVAIIGAGSIGLATLLVARAAGAADIVVTDPVATKRRLALELGATEAFESDRTDLVDGMRGTAAGRPDVTFDCVATAATVQAASELAVRGGSVVVVGVGHGPVQLPIERIQDEQISIAGSAMYVPADFTAAEQLVADGLAVDRLVSAHFTIKQFPEAFAAALGGDQVKVHVHGRADSAEGASS